MSYHYYLFILCAIGLLYEELYFISAETLEGYVHLISGVKTATKSSTKYFDLKLQTTESAGVRMVCYSPEKRQKLQQSQESKSPVKIAGLVWGAVCKKTLQHEQTCFYCDLGCMS